MRIDGEESDIGYQRIYLLYKATICMVIILCSSDFCLSGHITNKSGIAYCKVNKMFSNISLYITDNSLLTEDT